MMMLSPITQGSDYRLLTHKDYAIKMVESIIKDKDVDPCAKEMTEELGASGLFDGCFFLSFFLSFFLQLFITQYG